MIKETVDEYRFEEVLRFDEYASWSRGAIRALFDYYEQLSEEIEEDIELDPVAIRCEWSEYSDIFEAVYSYNQTFGEDIDEYDLLKESEKEELARDWLDERTTVLLVQNITPELEKITSILVMDF